MVYWIAVLELLKQVVVQSMSVSLNRDRMMFRTGLNNASWNMDSHI